MITTPVLAHFCIYENEVFKILYERNCITYLVRATPREEAEILSLHNHMATGLTNEEYDQVKCIDDRHLFEVKNDKE